MTSENENNEENPGVRIIQMLLGGNPEQEHMQGLAAETQLFNLVESLSDEDLQLMFIGIQAPEETRYIVAGIIRSELYRRQLNQATEAPDA